MLALKRCPKATVGLMVVLALWMYGASGCAQRSAVDVRIDGELQTDLFSFDAAGSILSGFDTRYPHRPWCAGDRILFGIHLKNGTLDKCWYVLLTLELPDFVRDQWEGIVESGAMPGSIVLPLGSAAYTTPDGGRNTKQTNLLDIQVETFDQEGKSLGAARSQMAEMFMSDGMYLPCAVILKEAKRKGNGANTSCWTDEMTGEQKWAVQPLASGSSQAFDANLYAYGSVQMLFRAMQSNDRLAPILSGVVSDGRVFWSALTNMSLSFYIEVDWKAAHSVQFAYPQEGGIVRAYSIPYRIYQGSTDFLVGRFTVVEPVSTLRLSAGLVSARGVNPSDAERVVSVHLLAARRGDGPELIAGWSSPKPVSDN